MMKYLPIREDRLRRIKEATSNDEIMKNLRDAIMNGWPEEKAHCTLKYRHTFKSEMC